MNCKESGDYIMRHLDGEVNDIENAQLKQHLKACKGCNDNYESLREVFSIIETDNAIEPPADFEVKVMDRINTLEVARKKRADGILVFIYSFVTVLLTVLAVAFMARFNGVNLFEIFIKTSDSFGSFSDTIFTLYSLVNETYHLIIRISEAFIQVFSILAGTYYFAIAALLILFIMLPQVLTGFVKQGGGDRK